MIVTRKLHFDSAHRLINHESKCKFLHGHRYVLEISFSADSLDSIGRVIDFGVIKQLLGTWIDNNWDHNTILGIKDKELGDAIEKHTNQKIYYIDCNPTAENLAIYLKDNIVPNIFKNHNLTCTGIRLYETPNCSVSYSEAVAR
jgi:6-pyruvoyltetrahydropterin/6-carboxytetrahydropterin synthase